MTIETKTAAMGGRVWVRSSALLPIILPSSPPPTVTMDSLAKLRAQIQGSGEEWDMDQTRWAEVTQKVLGISNGLADIYFETCALELNTKPTTETLPFHLLLTTLFLQLAWEARESTGDLIRATEEEAVGRWVCANVKNLLRLLGTLTPAQEQSLRTVLFSFSEYTGCALSAPMQREVKAEGDLEGTLATIRRGKRLAWQLEGDGGHRAVLERVTASGLHNAVDESSHAKLAISSLESGVPTVVVSQLCRQGLARKGGAVTGAKLVVHRCRLSRLCFLAHLSSVTVTKCTESKIFLGAVRGTLTLSRCRGMAVTAACGRLVVRDCHDLRISLLTPLNPIVSCSSTQISFAPLCSTYPSMQEDLLAAGLDLNQAGKWNLPIVLEDESREMKDTVASCSTTTINSFHLIDLPLQGVGRSDGELAKLSKEFQEESERKREKEELWESLVTALHPSQRIALQNRVDQKFSVFLAARQSPLNGPR